jgi:hypothetical protein
MIAHPNGPLNKTRATPAATNALQHSQQGGSLNVGAFRNRFETQQIGIFGFSCRYLFFKGRSIGFKYISGIDEKDL